MAIVEAIKNKSSRGALMSDDGKVLVKLLRESNHPRKVSMLQSILKKPLKTPSIDYIGYIYELADDPNEAISYWAKKVLEGLPQPVVKNNPMTTNRVALADNSELLFKNCCR